MQGGLSEGVEVQAVVGNEVDGPDGAQVHVNSHVFLHALRPRPAVPAMGAWTWRRHSEEPLSTGDEGTASGQPDRARRHH